MRTAIQFRSHLTLNEEILTGPVPFLPVVSAGLRVGGQILLPKTSDLLCFLPILTFNRKNMTVARPLLNGGSQ
jgi:hypothetical protein